MAEYMLAASAHVNLMPMIKLVTVLSLITAFLAYAAYHAFIGAYWLASTTLLTGLSLAWAVLQGPEFSLDVAQPFCAAISLLGALHYFSSSSVMKPGNPDLNLELALKAVETNYCPSEIQPDRSKQTAFRSLLDTMVEKCALQNHSDLLVLATDLTKTVYLDPVTGTVDGLYNDLTRGERISCQDVAYQMNALCPGWFSLHSGHH